MEYGGRNRRYYQVTEQGSAQLKMYVTEWEKYSGRITDLLEGRMEGND